MDTAGMRDILPCPICCWKGIVVLNTVLEHGAKGTSNRLESWQLALYYSLELTFVLTVN